MKMLSIRQWMVAGMLIFIGLAALFYHLADTLDQNVLHISTHQTAQTGAALDSAERTVTASAASWRDPTWQETTRQTLATLGVGSIIRDPSGTQIFRAGDARPSWHISRHVDVIEQGRPLGSVDLFTPYPFSRFASGAAILAILLALLFVRWQMGRYMVRPLEAMGRAARRIAAGNLDFTIPRSRVREVASVRRAFQAMGEGLRDSIERQAELEEERRFFVGAIAHDLRTPLFALRGSLVGLEQGLATSPEKAAWYVAVCRQKADQLDRLVNDLFAYTKADYLEQTLHRERLDLRSLLADAVDDAQPRAIAADVALTLTGPDAEYLIDGDEHLLLRALENLLDNALRYTPPNGKITVRWEAEADRASFTIADTGPGIAARDLPHLFDPLYRAEESRSRDTGGAGLGLTIARRILRAHGGDLVAANGSAGGAEFRGSLPLSSGETVPDFRDGAAVQSSTT